MNPRLFSHFFAWSPDGEFVNGRPAYATRPLTRRLLRCDPNDDPVRTALDYADEVADLNDYGVDAVLVMAKEGRPANTVFEWTEDDEGYWTRVLGHLAANKMPFIPCMQRAGDPRWPHTAVSEEGYAKAVLDCAERIDTFVGNVNRISSRLGLHQPTGGRPAYFINSAFKVPFRPHPELFWAEVNQARKVRHASLWGQPHPPLTIYKCDHGFDVITEYSGFWWTPEKAWRDLRTERVNFPDPKWAMEHFEAIHGKLLDHYGHERVVLPVSFGFDKYRHTVASGGFLCPPVYENRQQELAERLIDFFEKNKVGAFAVPWREDFEGENVAPQKEFDFRPALHALKMRTIGGIQ